MHCFGHCLNLCLQDVAIDAVLKDYSILMETMSEVNATTRDEYGLKAGGILAALEKFSTLFGLRLA